MSHAFARPSTRPLALATRRRFLAFAFVLLPLAGCSLKPGVTVETESRSFSETLPHVPGEVLRLANLAGAIELVPGSGDSVVIETTVHAAGRSAADTQKLLADMRWEKGRDREGRPEWVLTYPVDKYKSFHYNDNHHGWSINNGVWYRGKKVSLSTRKGIKPTLYADLRITCPGTGPLVVRNAIGDVDGGALSGTLTIDTGSGDVTLTAFDGDLTVDTGSGDVNLGTVRGETLVDTGSGEVLVGALTGNGRLDTGSGNVTVRKTSMGKLVVDTGSGEVLIEDGTVGDLAVDTGSGEVKVIGVELGHLIVDTGSGDVVVESSLTGTERVHIDTGSGDVRIRAGGDAAFKIALESGSGELVVHYDDAELEKSGDRVVAARRGNGGTDVVVDTGSGDCIVGPA